MPVFKCAKVACGHHIDLAIGPEIKISHTNVIMILLDGLSEHYSLDHGSLGVAKLEEESFSFAFLKQTDYVFVHDSGFDLPIVKEWV